MASVKPELYLYNLTLKKDSHSVGSIIGNFIDVEKGKKSKKSQELVVASNSVLTLYRFNSSTGKLRRLFDQDTFSAIRSIDRFKVSGSTYDSIVLTSDSGNLSVLSVSPKLDRFVPEYNEPYVKAGITRLTPGEYLSVDDKARALMVSAVEKNKLIYVLNRDLDSNKMTISSPLEANKSRNLTYSTIGLDVGYENPLFAAIECDYSNAASTSGATKLLNYYELDLGLNHVLRKYSEKIDTSSNFMLPIPGGLDGPSGLLLCSKNLIQYKYLSEKPHYLPIPRRSKSSADEECYIINGVVHKMKKSFFILLQSNFGDLFKVSIDYEGDTVNNPGEINSVEIKYFDTLPIMKSLLIFKSGFLFADSENGDKYVYQFEKTGDDEEKFWKSSNYVDVIDAVSEEDIYFEMRGLENLGLVDIVESLNPIMDSKLLTIPRSRDEPSNLQVPTIYSACGNAARSSLKVLTKEAPISELVSSELPADAQQVFTTKTFDTDKYDRYLVLSFLDGTLVLSIGENVEEVTTSGISTDGPTMLIKQMGQSSVIQVQNDSVRNLQYDPDAPDLEPSTDQWLPPAGIKILHATATEYQLVLGLSNRQLVYFDHENGKLHEHSERPELLGLISSLSLEKLEPGKLRSRFLAVGTSENTIHILSMDPGNLLDELAVQALSSTPVDLKILTSFDSVDLDEDTRTAYLYLHIGMADGIYARIGLDERSGAFGEVRSAVIGAKPVKLTLLELFGQNMILCLSTRTYLGFSANYSFTLLALQDKILTHGFNFKSEDCPENGIVGVYSNNLTICTVDEIKDDFILDSITLRYTPKKMCEHDGVIYVIESENHTQGSYLKDGDEQQLQDFQQVEDEENVDQEVFQQFGYPQSENQWSSCLQVISVIDRQAIQTIELGGNNESLLSVCVAELGGTHYLIAGTSKDQTFLPNKNLASYLRVYEITSEKTLHFKHSTKIDGLPLSLMAFNKRLLVGCGSNLVLYDLGTKQLLRKCLFKTNCQQIVKLDLVGSRIAVADIRLSITFVVYKPLENKFILFATDTIARHVATFQFVDYDTVVGSDRFGQLFVLRCPLEVSKISDEDNHGTYISTKDEYLNECPYRLDQLASFYLPDIVTSFSKGHLSINAAGADSIVYTGLQGTVGIMIALPHKSDIDFFVHLQRLVAEKYDLVTLRDYLKFRSYYVPLKSVIDGDLVECFLRLDATEKLRIAGRLDTTVRNVEKRVADMRSRIYF